MLGSRFLYLSLAALEKKGVHHKTYWIEGRSHIMSHLFPAGAIHGAIDFLGKRLMP